MTHSRSINITSEDNNSSQSSIPEHILVIKKKAYKFVFTTVTGEKSVP